MNNKNTIYTFVAISTAIYILESYIPRPLPWIRIGLSNVIILVVLYFFSIDIAIKVVFYRVFFGSLFTGTLFTPTFFISISGGIMATISMYFAIKIFKKILSPVGVSIIGAETHIITQLIFVYFFIIKDASIFNLTPFLILFSIFSGTIVGIIGNGVINELVDFFK